jgi:hypothetical protein
MKKRLLAVTLSLHAAAALAADKDPLEYSLRQYGLVLALALLGGLVSFYAKVRAGHVSAWNLAHLIGELATSAFAGLLCFWMAEVAGLPQLVTACLVGIAGHMGARAIAVFEQWAQRRWGLPDSSAATPSNPGGNP